MRFHEIYESVILLEYKREVTASKMGKRILQSLPKDAIFVNKVKDFSDDDKINAVLVALEKMDPTKNKQFVQWLVKNYGSFRIEDSGRVKDALEKFVSLKTQISRRDKSVDINSYNWSTFQDMIDEITDVDISDGNTSGDFKNKNDIKVLYDGPYGKLIIPKTEEASCEIGSGTRWCTAAKNDNKFSYYVEQEHPNSNLYVWIDKNGEKFQFHFESEQYMNAKDDEIDYDDMIFFVNKHPVLSKFFNKIADINFKIKYVKPLPKKLVIQALKEKKYIASLYGTKLSDLDEDILDSINMPKTPDTYEVWYDNDTKKIYLNVDIDRIISKSLLDFIEDPHQYMDSSDFDKESVDYFIGDLSDDNLKILYDKFTKIVESENMTVDTSIDEFIKQCKRNNFHDILEEYLDEDDEPVDFEDNVEYSEMISNIHQMLGDLESNAYEKEVHKKLMKSIKDISLPYDDDQDEITLTYFKIINTDGELVDYVGHESNAVVFETDVYFDSLDDAMHDEIYSYGSIDSDDLNMNYYTGSWDKDEVNEMFDNYFEE